MKTRLLSIWGGLILGFLVALPTASALNIQHHRPTTGAMDGYQLYTSDTLKQKEFAVGFNLHYGQHLLTLFPEVGPSAQIVDDVVMADFLFEVGLFDWLTAALDMPLTVFHNINATTGVTPSYVGGGAPGDLALTLRTRIFDAEQTSTGLGLAFVPTITFPTGDNNKFVGDTNVTGILRLVGDWVIKSNRFYLNGAYRLRQKEIIGTPPTVIPLVIDEEILYGAGWQRPIIKRWGLDGIVELAGDVEISRSSTERTNPLEVFIMGRKPWELENGDLILQFGGSVGLTEGYGTPNFRTIVGLAYHRIYKEKPAPIVEDVIELSGKINFEFDKAIIKPDSFHILDEAVQIMREHPEIEEVTIEGHTDSRGSDEYNQRLSERRAQALKMYLIQKGIEADRLQSIGYGEARPIATNDTDEGRAENRRSVFRITKRSD